MSNEPWALRDVVLDLECTMPGPDKKKAHPKFGSKIVLAGLKPLYPEALHSYNIVDVDRMVSRPREHCDYDSLMYIGHNIKFDLLHLLEKGTLDYDTLSRCTIYDTQVAEYLLSGQQEKMTSLEQLAVKYGGTVKDDRVKELWAAGVDTADIDTETLSEYLKGDLRNTEIVYKGQLDKLMQRDDNFIRLFWAMMDVTKALTVVEYNGMQMDLTKLEELRNEYERKVSEHSEHLRRRLRGKYSIGTAPFEFNAGSNHHIAAIFDSAWAGRCKYKVKEHVGTYKNGKPKYKTVEHTLAEHGSVTADDAWTTIDSTSAGNPVVDDAVLREIADDFRNGSLVQQAARWVLEYRDAKKNLSTYLEGLVKHIAPDSRLYGNLNQCVTSTGRLSSSNPNLQNMTGKSDVKKAFVSRFGDDGEIVELDYSQLEVIALAVITGDEQLKKDIMYGQDLHYETGKKVFGWCCPSDMSKEARRAVKGVNFGLIYGGTANGLAKSTGQPKHVVSKLIEAFFKRYPGVKQWHESMVAYVQGGYADPVLGAKTKEGNPVHESYYMSPTGRKYSFRTYDAPDWLKEKGTVTSFSPTEIKNYMIQGTATGDIVPIALSILCNEFVEYHTNDIAYLTNTVHDSIIIDVRKAYKEEVIEKAKSVMEDMPSVLKNMFGWDFDLPLKVGVSYGPNWKDQEEIE